MLHMTQVIHRYDVYAYAEAEEEGLMKRSRLHIVR